MQGVLCVPRSRFGPCVESLKVAAGEGKSQVHPVSATYSEGHSHAQVCEATGGRRGSENLQREGWGPGAVVSAERSGQPLATLPVGARNATAPVTPSSSLAVESTLSFWWKVEVRGPGRPRVSPPCVGQSDVGAVGLPRDAARSPASLPSSLFHGGPSVAPF